MELDLLEVKMGIDGYTVEGCIELGKITAFRKHCDDPNWTIVYTTDHRVHCIYEKYDSFCKRLNELAHD